MDELRYQATGRRSEILDVAATLIGDHGMRTSIEEIADASGIQAGSLYHHFGSKENIYLELVARYRADLDRVADQVSSDPAWLSYPPLDRITKLGATMAECAARNRAALLLTLYEPPTGAGTELADLASGTTKTVRAAMADTLRSAHAEGRLRSEVDLELVADQITQSMLHIGIGVYHRTRAARGFPAMKCNVILHGVAVHPVHDGVLDSSPARHAADAAIKSWNDEDGEETAARIRAAARSEFARRGYELTTVRNIAAAAGLSPAGMYFHVKSKDELFWSIMRSYAEHVAYGWSEVASSSSTPVEKLDGLLWLLTNSMNRFAPEHRAQLFGIRYAPPTGTNLSLGFQAQMRKLKGILAEGMQRGELDMQAPSMEMWARCVISLIFMPENIVREAGLQGALHLGRDTVLRGIAESP